MIGVRYTICHWTINRTDPQNLLSTTLDVPLHLGRIAFFSLSFEHLHYFYLFLITPCPLFSST